jgi:hypothetical protein
METFWVNEILRLESGGGLMASGRERQFRVCSKNPVSRVLEEQCRTP